MREGRRVGEGNIEEGRREEGLVVEGEGRRGRVTLWVGCVGSRKIHCVKDLPLAESPPLNYAVHCMRLYMIVHACARACPPLPPFPLS